MPPSIWLTSPVRIDDQPGIDRGGRARHAHRAVAAVNLDLRHYGHVASEILVLGKTDAAAARAVTLLAVFPAGFLGGRLDHRPRARIGEMREPERNRIDAGRGRELIHEGFEREYIGIGAERP
jgi:hypothetical protein